MTLEDLLRSRDARVERQRELIALYPGMTLLCLTVQLPGPVKRDDASLRIARAGIETVKEAFDPLFEEQRDLETGFEAFFVVDAPLLDAKRICCRIEDTHPLGRLMDIDVITSMSSTIPLTPPVILKPALSLPKGAAKDLPSESASDGEDHATLGNVRGGTVNEVNGGAEQSEASEPPKTPSELVVMPLGREELGLQPRRCLVCDRPAKDCIRARTHTREELMSKIDKILEYALNL